MEDIYEIEQTKKTPYIKFNLQQGALEIKGQSLPIYALEFYADLVRYVELYLSNPLDQTTIHLHLEYINTSSSKVLFQILTFFEKAMDMGKHVEFNWYASTDDIDMIDLGKQFQNSLKIATHIIEVE